MGLRQYFYIAKSERRAYLLLLVVLGVFLLLHDVFFRPTPRPAERLSAADSLCIDSFLAHEHARVPRWSEKKASPYYAVPMQQWESFEFDPNTADSTALLRLGLQPFQVRNVYKYRSKGGRYRSAEDFGRLYGLTEEQYRHLAPLIRIGKLYQLHVAASSSRDSAGRDTVLRFPKKLASGTRLNLNVADTAALRCVPGIGAYYAQAIVSYRERLGGFVSLNQLAEVPGMTPDLAQQLSRWFFLHKAVQPRLNLNKLSLRKLAAHPYMSPEQARRVVEVRRMFGKLHSLEELSACPEFSSESLERLRPYVCF